MNQKLKFASILTAVLLLFVGCHKEKTPAVPPIANAGSSQTIQLPVNSVTLTGSGTTTNGNIVGYLWSLVSGPGVPVISSPSSVTTTVSGLIAGTYVLQFTVSDNIGLTGVDTVSVVVNPGVQQTVTFNPTNNINEGHVDNHINYGGTGDIEIPIGSWTVSGGATSWREFIKFDLSQVPVNANILSAVLYLYAMPNPGGGDFVHAHSGTANAFIIERLAADWTFAGMTWDNQPGTTATNMVIVPQSTSAFEDNAIGVTALVQDMQTDGNFGFAFRLQNENYYNIRQYASSYYSNAALHPKLVITYQ